MGRGKAWAKVYLEGRQAARDRHVDLAVQPDVQRLLGGSARLGGGLGQRRRVQLHVVLAARLQGDIGEMYGDTWEIYPARRCCLCVCFCVCARGGGGGGGGARGRVCAGGEGACAEGRGMPARRARPSRRGASRPSSPRPGARAAAARAPPPRRAAVAPTTTSATAAPWAAWPAPLPRSSARQVSRACRGRRPARPPSRRHRRRRTWRRAP